MSGFDLIARVLKRLEGPLREEHGQNLDNRLKDKIKYLQSSYKGLHASPKGVDFLTALLSFVMFSNM